MLPTNKRGLGSRSEHMDVGPVAGTANCRETAVTDYSRCFWTWTDGKTLCLSARLLRQPICRTTRSTTLLETLTVVHLVKKSASFFFMKSRDSQPRSRQPASGRHPEPPESNSRPTKVLRAFPICQCVLRYQLIPPLLI